MKDSNKKKNKKSYKRQEQTLKSTHKFFCGGVTDNTNKTDGRGTTPSADGGQDHHKII